MAQTPSKTSGIKALNIMNLTRGIFDFRKPASVEKVSIRSFGTSELIPDDTRSKLLRISLRPETNVHSGRAQPLAGMIGMMSGSYVKVGQDRMENRRILELMPDVRKATRLMIASIFSPSDLSRHEIGFKFDIDGVDEDTRNSLGTIATKFFQRKLNLKTAAAQWVYQFGYESGSCVFAIVPLQSFSRIVDESFVGTESFIKDVVEPVCHESLFGFGDVAEQSVDVRTDALAMESFTIPLIEQAYNDKPKPASGLVTAAAKDLVNKFIGTEALNLTDNPSVLRVGDVSNTKRKQRTNKALKAKFKTPSHDPMLEVELDTDTPVVGNPLLMRLPPESVTVIHTPGDPADHQGYLVLLDITGNPVSIITQDVDEQAATANFDRRSNDIFGQVHQAYGIGNSNKSSMDRQTMQQLYTKIVSQHIEKRLGKAGYGQVDIPNLDATMRCLFSRMMREKRTRILFLPKELVTYMTFETDQYGYGVSKLNGIKFALGMKMALQVSRVLAAIKSAMDKRVLTMKFDENNMEQPEALINVLLDQYVQKNSMTFSTDPGHIQAQIQQKSYTVKTEGIPGMDNFSVDNVAADKGNANDFDSGMTEYLDKTIINGLDVPASTMNSLNDDEYARSVTTTNLFFAMEVQIYQDVVVKHISDVARKYGQFSEEFQKEILELLPELGKKTTCRKGRGDSSTDESNDDSSDGKIERRLPVDFTLEDLIAVMTITLPKPNIAPSKAQFESLDGMITAITNTMTALFPDELAGGNDKVRATLAMFRARVTAINIREYLESVGMTSIELPEGSDFSRHLSGLSELQNGLENLTQMIQDKVKLSEAAAAAETAGVDPSATPPGYT